MFLRRCIAAIMPLMPEFCRWSGMFTVGAFCGGIRGVVRAMGGVLTCVGLWIVVFVGFWGLDERGI